MRNKKLISMLLLPAAFVACTDDIIEGNGFTGNNSKEAVEDLVLNVSFETENFSRAAYAGDSLGNPYQNFYLAPEFDATSGELSLSDNKELKGDMLGYCLSNGANAITNLPFYIAGYASTPSTAKGAKTKIYIFDDQATGNSLYYLGLDATKQTSALLTKSDFDASVADVAKKPANKALDADELDVRMGIVRSNAGIMTGNYVAYFPYNKAWTEPSGIPAVPMKALWNPTLSDDRFEALANVDVDGTTPVSFNDYIFAVSQQANEVKGGTKAGDVSLKPLTSAWTVNLKNKTAEKDYDESKLEEIKRVTIRTIEEGAAGFTLEGKVALNSLNTITASKSTDLIGASFEPQTIEKTDSLFFTIPFYANPAITGYVIEVYNTKGQVATIEKATGKFEAGKAYLTTIDVKDLKFTNTTRKIFSAQDFVDEAKAGGDLMLMTDINVANATGETFAKNLNIKGAKKLTLTNGTFSANLTMAEGSHLVLNGAAVDSIAADTLTVSESNDFGFVAANTLNVNDNITLTNAEIEVANVAYGKALTTEAVKANAEGKNGTNVSITTLNNKGTFNAKGTTATIVGTLNNLGNAAAKGETSSAKVYVYKPLTVTVINNAAGVNDNPTTTAVNEMVNAGSVFVSAEINSSAVINNNGSLNWNNGDITPTINNYGVFNTKQDVELNFKGTLNNAGNFTVNSSIEGTAGEVNNAVNGVIDIQGYFGFTTTKLNINAGQVIVNGSVNGNSNITVTEGAEFIATAANENVLLSTLGTSFINAKYTGIKVSSSTWPATVLTTTKKIYLNGDIEFTKATALNGGLVIEDDATVTATNLELTTTSITINAGKTFEVGTKTNVTVNGTITNNGTYKQANDAVVWCNGIVTGTGATWVNKPN